MKPFRSNPMVTAAAASLVVMVSALSAAATDWTGGYIGAQLGHERLIDDHSITGQSFGLQAGYDWQIDNWVVGAGVDTTSGIGANNGFAYDTYSRVKLRGGYAFGNSLAYLTVGAAHGSDSFKNGEWGQFVGVGIEHRLNDNWSIQGELSRNHFDTFGDSTKATVGVNFRF